MLFWVSILLLATAYTKAAVLYPDCVQLNINDHNEKLLCPGTVLVGEGHCGENVCARQEGESCHFEFLRWPDSSEAKPPRCDKNAGLICKPAAGFGTKGWSLWAGRGRCEDKETKHIVTLE